MSTNFDIEEVKAFIKDSSPESKIYFGCDSERFKKRVLVTPKTKTQKAVYKYEWMARFSTVVVIHKDGNHGAKIFGRLETENVDDGNPSRPFNRMWKEVEKVSELVQECDEVLVGKHFHIHLDINPNKDEGSNVAYGAAKGYIYSMHGIEPQFKPQAFASTCAADRMGLYK